MLELKNISKRYQLPNGNQQRVVLNGVSLKVPEKSAIAITGVSGSGKTTLLNILGTLDKPTDGSVLFHGCDITGMDTKELANLRNKNIGFVFQLHYLLPQLTILENVLLPAIVTGKIKEGSPAHARAMDLLGQVGLSGHVNQFPAQLSGGECQRAAFVRALINNPALILADEPTGSLDAATSEILEDMLIDLNSKQGTSLVVVTHSQKLAGKMDTNYSLENGQLL